MQYMGSKSRIAKDIVPIIQSYITEKTVAYIEPFVGGANVIDKINHHNKIGYDINNYLIELLKFTREQSKNLPDNISEEQYNDVKANKNLYDEWYAGFVGFICSFSGKFFGGYARGDGRNYALEGYKNLNNQSKKLKNIQFKCSDFKKIDTNIKNSLIYCDPPYRGTTKYKTGEFPYEEFYDWCRKMSENNVVLISEYNMPDDFECVWEKEINTSVNRNKKSNDPKNNRTEKLFMVKGGMK